MSFTRIAAFLLCLGIGSGTNIASATTVRYEFLSEVITQAHQDPDIYYPSCGDCGSRIYASLDINMDLLDPAGPTRFYFETGHFHDPQSRDHIGPHQTIVGMSFGILNGIDSHYSQIDLMDDTYMLVSVNAVIGPQAELQAISLQFLSDRPDFGIGLNHAVLRNAGSYSVAGAWSTAAPIPLPAGAILLISALGIVGLWRRRSMA